MNFKLILFLILLLPIDNFANENINAESIIKVEKPRKNKQGRYKVKKT